MMDVTSYDDPASRQANLTEGLDLQLICRKSAPCSTVVEACSILIPLMFIIMLVIFLGGPLMPVASASSASRHECRTARMGAWHFGTGTNHLAIILLIVDNTMLTR